MYHFLIPFHCSYARTILWCALAIAVPSLSHSPVFAFNSFSSANMYNFIDINAVGLLLRSHASHLFKQIIDRIHTYFGRSRDPSKRAVRWTGNLWYLHKHSVNILWLRCGDVAIFPHSHLEIIKSLKVLQRVCHRLMIFTSSIDLIFVVVFIDLFSFFLLGCFKFSGGWKVR